jgi:hypothetical protein
VGVGGGLSDRGGVLGMEVCKLNRGFKLDSNQLHLFPSSCRPPKVGCDGGGGGGGEGGAMPGPGPCRIGR